MPLLAGLGNPGSKYDDTRHNVGFALADFLARACRAENDWKTQGKTLLCKAALGPLSLQIAKPQTFMNLSGEALQPLLSFYKIRPTEMVVVTDDITLPIGSLRIRANGGHGGHNGLRNIIDQIGEDFPRIRIGLGLCPPGWDLSNFVLVKMGAAEKEAVQPIFADFASVVETGFTKGWDFAASKFNRTAKSP